MKQNFQNLKKEIRSEMKAIAREYKVSNWSYERVERMEPDEAFNRGYYRALQNILKSAK